MNEIEEDISSFEPGVFEPTRRTLVRFEFDCVCDPTTLAEIYEITGSFTTIIDVVAASLDEPSCFEVTYSGSNDSGVLAFIDFNTDRNDTGWAVGFDDGFTQPVLFKIAGSGNPPDCDIASPAGNYEGDGETAHVGAI